MDKNPHLNCPDLRILEGTVKGYFFRRGIDLPVNARWDDDGSLRIAIGTPQTAPCWIHMVLNIQSNSWEVWQKRPNTELVTWRVYEWLSGAMKCAIERIEQLKYDES